jgi:hypothetical protein
MHEKFPRYILALLLDLINGFIRDWLTSGVDIAVGTVWAAEVDVEMWSEGPSKNYNSCILETTKHCLYLLTVSWFGHFRETCIVNNDLDSCTSLGGINIRMLGFVTFVGS